jgi:hypothetical protein
VIEEYLKELVNLFTRDEVEELGKAFIPARVHGQVAGFEVVGRRDADLRPVSAHIARRDALVGPVEFGRHTQAQRGWAHWGVAVAREGSVLLGRVGVLQTGLGQKA